MGSADFIGKLIRGPNAVMLAGADPVRPNKGDFRSRLAYLGRSVVAILVGHTTLFPHGLLPPDFGRSFNGCTCSDWTCAAPP